MFKNYLFNNRPLGVSYNVIPDPISWGDTQTGSFGSVQTAVANCGQFTSIGGPINIRIEYTANQQFYSFQYYTGLVKVTSPYGDCVECCDQSMQEEQNGGPYFSDVGFNSVSLSNHPTHYNIVIQPNEWLQFIGPKETGTSLSITFTIKNMSDGGTVLGTFTHTSEPPCFLTTAAVEYKELEDDGPELTAMRQLRERYAVEDADLIEEYGETSAQIIQSVEQQGLEEEVYEEIYQVILTIQLAISEDRWEDARQEYKDLYSNLKERFV
jgi:hypothetical protein